MRNPFLAVAVLAGALASPLAAQAQTAVVVDDGVTVGGPYMGIQEVQRPRFREYVVRERVPSYVVDEPVEVGAVLPDVGVSYYDVPEQYGATPYRYTVINDRTVLVDPRSRRIMQVLY